MLGTDAEETARKRALFPKPIFGQIGSEKRERLRRWGWKMLGHKPRHVILLTHRRTGALLYRHG